MQHASNRTKAVIFRMLLAIALTAGGGRAEFPVGASLPKIALPATEGSQVELAIVNGALAITHGATQSKPNALVMHLLQPDCLQCRAQLKELQAISDRFGSRGVAVLGIAHRGEMKDLEQLDKDLSITFPLLHGPESPIARQFAAGDSMAIADQSGVVRYAQLGFGQGDEALWSAALDELLEGRSVTRTTVDRERLAVGDRFPALELASIRTGKPMALVGKNGRLTFIDDKGKEKQLRGAVGFFSRY